MTSLRLGLEAVAHAAVVVVARGLLHHEGGLEALEARPATATADARQPRCAGLARSPASCARSLEHCHVMVTHDVRTQVL